jgi:hypothetical protein
MYTRKEAIGWLKGRAVGSPRSADMTKSETPWTMDVGWLAGLGWRVRAPTTQPPPSPPPAQLLLLCQKRLARYSRPCGELSSSKKRTCFINNERAGPVSARHCLCLCLCLRASHRPAAAQVPC